MCHGREFRISGHFIGQGDIEPGSPAWQARILPLDHRDLANVQAFK